MRIKLFVLILSVQAVVSCNSGQERPKNKSVPGKEEMAELNKYMVQKDRERIQNYIDRKSLEMTESESGLWYQVLSEGRGDYLTDNDRIIMEYECTLIDGTFCYSSKESGPSEFVLGRSDMEAGLDQGLRMLKPGAEAIFIIPPFLAYGIVGDGDKIPPRAIIIYNVSVEKQN